ncbi:MAG: exodeoxyribonuclease I [Pseudomonadota bacterium]|nr:exodeoxyribonuclease I [Pseudomonadota bacterium]
MTDFSFYWHDYETWGLDRRRDRPVQFAGQRTDYDLNPIGEPSMLYAEPPRDRLPSPEACLVTGLTPQRVRQQNPLCEAEFIRRIRDEMMQPNTCSLGYNSLRFDDEVTRFTLYRNLLDPYQREWGEGRSRWDLIDALRMARALRPEGIEWPTGEESKPSMKLEDLTRANDIEHSGAHDALADVQATIALARLLKTAQPKLFEYAFENRGKQRVFQMLRPEQPGMMLHISGMYPPEYLNLAVVMPVARMPGNKNAIVVYDLRFDPAELLRKSPEKLNKLLFTPAAELPEGASRPALKTVHANRSPALSPIMTLDAKAQKRLQIDLTQCKRHFDTLRQARGLAKKIAEIHSQREFAPDDDPETALYGGFIPDPDRRLLERITALPPEELIGQAFAFKDSRLPELLFRYRARNYPDTLSDEEQQKWEAFRRRRLAESTENSTGTEDYFKQIAKLSQLPERSPAEQEILAELEEWGRGI